MAAFNYNFHNIQFVTWCHFFLHCSIYTNERLSLLNVIWDMDNGFLKLGDSHILEVLLHGRKFLDIK